MGRILVGTASWTDKSLIASGRFYPPEVKTPEERLRYYASQFSFVEVDSTYYSADMEDVARDWVTRTPDGFVFNVKAFRLFTTHQTPNTMLPSAIRDDIRPLPEGKKNWYYKDVPEAARDELWAYFRRTLAPLRDAGKLGAVILQMPPWFLPNDETKSHLIECAERLDGYRIAVEFRNKYWLNERGSRRTLAFLRENGLAMVIVDEPQGFTSSVPQVWEVTDPELSVVRLHGRNAETWEKKGLKAASERFNYLYDAKELRELARPVAALAGQAREVHVTFNNNYEDQAQVNARQFVGALHDATASPARRSA